jgi:predicted HicB family RNase H-like nuclease
MSRLTLRLPKTLHQQLVNLAENEGISLNQYIVYALTRQVTAVEGIERVPEAEVSQQQQAFNHLLQQLGEVSSAEVEAALNQREQVKPEAELSPEVIARFQQRLNDLREG